MRHPRWAVSAAVGSALALLPVGAAYGSSSPFITGYAGTGTGAAPIAGPATSSPLWNPVGVTLDSGGDLYIADSGNQLVEEVTPDGTLSILDGATPALTLGVVPNLGSGPAGIAVDGGGDAYVADPGRSFVYEFTPLGVRTVFAGTGTPGAAVPGAAASSPVGQPYGVARDAGGDVYISDRTHNEVYKVDPTGTLSVFAGTGASGPPAVGPATASDLASPAGLAVDANGDLYIADSGNDVVEKVTPAGALSIVAGSGTQGAPTAGSALGSDLDDPLGVAVDGAGDVFIADSGNYDVEEVTAGGQLSVLAGTGTAGTPTFGLFANGQALGDPTDVAVDTSGSVLVADEANNAIDRIGLATPGVISAFSASVSGTTATLTFNAPTDTGLFAVSGYEVSSDGGQTWQSLSTSGSGALSATVSGLSTGATYTFEVRADNGAGSGPATAGLSLTVPVPPPATTGGGSASTSGGGSSTAPTTTSTTTSSTLTLARPAPKGKGKPAQKPSPKKPVKPKTPATPSTAFSLAVGRSVSGGVSASVNVPGPGTVYVLATEAHEGLTSGASNTTIKPGAGRFTYAAATVIASRGGPVAAHLQRTVAGWAMLVRHRLHGWALHVNVSVIYVPTSGSQLSASQKVLILPAGPPSPLASVPLGAAASVIGG